MKEFFGKEPAQGRQPRRGRGGRRGDPGRRALRRGQGPAAARRHAALARHRDARRRHDDADRAQHHDPDPQERGVLDRVRQPDLGRDPRAAGRAADGRRQPHARQVPPRRESRRRRAACRRSRSRSTSTRTASSTSRPRTAPPARRRRSRSPPPPAWPRTRSSRWSSDAQSHAEEDKQRREEIEARNRADALVYTTEKTLAENRDKLPASEVEAAEKALEAAKKAVAGRRARADRGGRRPS